MADKKKHAGHGFHRTSVEHHKDKSHTVHHQHESGAAHDVKHAVANLDGVHHSMEDNLGQPNPGEMQANAGDHGVPQAQAGPAGLPAAPAPAGVSGMGA